MSDFVYQRLDVDNAHHLASAFHVARECELINDGTSDTTLESITAQVRGADAWREAQRLVMYGDQPVGLLAVEKEDPAREVFLDVYAIGSRREEVMSTLMTHGVEQARRVAVDDVEAFLPADSDPLEMNAGFWQATAATYTTDTAYVGVIEAHGFVPVRSFWRMILPLSDWSSTPPVAPPGVTVRVVDGEGDQRAMVRLRNESFADHYGETVVHDFEDYLPRLLETPGCDPSRWWIAELDGEPVALCILDDSKIEFDESYVRTLGVVTSARGRGIARWLLQLAAADAVERGLAGLALSVDGANTTGATRLYESVGFRTRQQIDLYCYPLVDSALSR